MRTRPTILYTHGGGRLGNQVIRFVHWMAWARTQAKPIEVVNLAFWPYAKFFAEWQLHPGCAFPGRSERADGWARRCASVPTWLALWPDQGDRLIRALHAAGRWRYGWQSIALDDLRGEGIDLDGEGFLSRVSLSRMTVLGGWKIASWRLVAEQQSELRHFFRPGLDWLRRPQEFVLDLRRKFDLVIGLLIRQSDYRVWADGRFYFDTEQYVAWVRQILDLHVGRRVAVIVASEDWQNPALFAGLPAFMATGNPRAGGHWFENWIELSLCDLIVSPPSTFSATAAFLSAVPIWPLVQVDQLMAFDQIIPDNLAGAARHPQFSQSVK